MQIEQERFHTPHNTVFADTKFENIYLRIVSAEVNPCYFMLLAKQTLMK